MIWVSRKNFLIISFFILILYFIGRIINGNVFLVDSFQYLQTAELLKTGDYFNFTNDFKKATILTQRGLTYPVFLLISGFTSNYGIIAIQTVFTFFSFYLLSLIYQKTGGKNYFFLLFFLIFTPSIFIYSHLLMTESFAMIFILGIFYFLLDYKKKLNILFIQLLLILLIFLKPVFYLFPILNLVFFGYLFFKEKNKYFLTSVIPLVLVFLFMSYNQKRTDYFHFSSMQNINLIDYNIYLHISKDKGLINADLWKSNVYENAEKYQTFKEKNQFLNEIGKEYIQNNFLSYTYFHCYGALRGTLDPGRFDLMTFKQDEYNDKVGLLSVFNKEGSVAALKAMLNNNFWIVLILFLILIVNFFKLFFSVNFIFKSIRKNTFTYFYITTFILYYIFITGPVNTSRYMVAVQGVLIVLASLYFDNKKNIKT